MTGVPEEIVVVDYGSQFAQLITRRIREHHVYCRVVTPAAKVAEVASPALKGVILSGGPASVYEPGAPSIDPAILALGVPVLGICYGMQLVAHLCGARVAAGGEREFGRQELEVLEPSPLFDDQNARAPLCQAYGRAQPGEACADDDDVRPGHGGRGACAATCQEPASPAGPGARAPATRRRHSRRSRPG